MSELESRRYGPAVEMEGSDAVSAESQGGDRAGGTHVRKVVTRMMA